MEALQLRTKKLLETTKIHIFLYYMRKGNKISIVKVPVIMRV